MAGFTCDSAQYVIRESMVEIPCSESGTTVEVAWSQQDSFVAWLIFRTDPTSVVQV